MIRRAASSPATWVGSRIVAQGLEFGAWVLLARRLGTSAVGVLAVASIIARLLGLIADWGAAFRGPRDVVREGRDSDLIRALVQRRQIAGVVLAVGMLVALLALGHAAVAPIVVAVVARGANRDWIALGESRRIDAAVPLLVQGTVVCSLVLLVDSIAWAAAAIAVGYLAGLVLSIERNPVPRGQVNRNVAVDGWYLMAGLADQVLVSSDTVLIVWIQTSVDAGIYNSMYRLPLAWLTLIGLCTAAAVPMVAEAVKQGRSSMLVTHRRADRVAVLSGLAVLPVAVVAHFLVEPLFGSDFLPGRPALAILFVAAAVTTISAPYRVLYTAFAPDRTVAWVTVGAASANVLANLAFIPWWGIEGAAATTVASQLLMLGFLGNWSRSARHAAPDLSAAAAVDSLATATK